MRSVDQFFPHVCKIEMAPPLDISKYGGKGPNACHICKVLFSDEALEKHRKLHTVKAENAKKSFSPAKSMLKERGKGPTNYVIMKHKAKKAAKFTKTVAQDLNAKLNKWKEAENKAKEKGKEETGNQGGKKK
ncbi:hypothetical protein ACH5RR_037980 [Cinchona calisaya]|uniref:C2H2-type domain-containing protein n=1 Tax=Cinchona calisaya TaxID=153742 RepID=A0ABD2YA31_9GENT